MSLGPGSTEGEKGGGGWGRKSIFLTHFLGLPLGRFGPVGIGLGW